MSLTSARIRALNAVVEEGGFSAAARRLGVSQPAVTQQIRELQTEYGIVLFERQGGVPLPTAACRDLYRITSEITRREEDALTLLREHQSLDRGELRIGLGNALPGMRFVAAFRARYPGVDVRIEMGGWQQVIDAILAKRVDVAVLPEVPNEARFRRTRCGNQSIVALIPPKHRLARSKAVYLADLATETLICRTSQALVQRTVDAAARAANVSLRPAIVVNTRDAVLEAVASGLGVGFGWCSGSALDEGLTKVPVREIDTALHEYAFHLSSPSPEIASRFLTVVSDTADPN